MGQLMQCNRHQIVQRDIDPNAAAPSTVALLPNCPSALSSRSERKNYWAPPGKDELEFGKAL